MRTTVRLVLAATVVLTGLSLGTAAATAAGRVEVVEVKGIIDGSVERAVRATIESAERERAELVVLQIDSNGAVGDGRAQRLIDAVDSAGVPVAAWVGPPGARARHGAAAVVYAADVPAVSALSELGPVQTLDLRRRTTPEADDVVRPDPSDVMRAASVAELLEDLDGMTIGSKRFSTDPADVAIRFHKLDIFGRVLHAAAQPSIAYLLLLVGLVGVVFELFHPSTGPAGIAGLAGLALAVYGVVTLGGSWFGLALIVTGVAAFCVDLRFQSLGPLTAVGFAGLVAGSILLFNGPWLRASPWVLGFGIAAMVAFLLGAMTRVLRDLRAVARGELEVTDAHPHPNGDHP